jgi:HYDIN/CFA65/VesB-like, Ig-like domain/NHL repeat
MRRRLLVFVAIFLTALSLAMPAQDVITTVIGGGPNGIPALDAFLSQPYGVAVDSTGNYYFAAFSQNRVFKVNAATKIISVVAGSGALGYSGDGVVGGAGNADLYHPYAVAVDNGLNVYIAEQGNCVVRKVTPAGTITTIAGTAGQCNDVGNDLNNPSGVAVDGSGNLFIGDFNNCVVKKVVLSTLAVSTYAGTLGSCGYSGNGSKATSAQLNGPAGVATDAAGNLYIGDANNCVIREVTKSTGNINTIGGNHTCGYSGDGAKATSAEMNTAYGLAVNDAGTTVTFADYNNQRIRQFTIGGNINTVAGTGAKCTGDCGNGGLATKAKFDFPVGVAVSSTGTIYVGDDDNQVVDSFTVGGDLNIVAGNLSNTVETLTNGAPADGVQLNLPFGIAVDPSNNVFIADSNNFLIREAVKSTGLVNFFAGTAGTAGFTGDGGQATSAEISFSYGVARDSAGNVYIADTHNCVIQQVNTGGTINLFAGLVVGGTSTLCGFSGDGGTATNAEIDAAYGVAVDSKGNVYVADQGEHVVRKISGGIITTIAGVGGIEGYSGDGGPAANALLNQPEAITVDNSGNVFIADTNNCRIREINATTGMITTVAGNGDCSFTGDGIATENAVEFPQGVAVDANDNLFVSDFSDRIRWISPSGFMTTIAGTGNGGYNGDGGLATAALMNEPTGIALDSAGNVLFSDYNNGRVRSISAFPALSTSVGNLAFGLTSVGSTSSPETITVSAYGPVTINNISVSSNFSEADDCPAALANGTTCTIYAYFEPTASGTLNGNITINDNGFFSQVNTVSLTGLGSAISLSGAPLTFGSETVKVRSVAKTVTVTNNGTNTITMGAITLTNTTDYAISANTCPASGKTLAANGSCTISVTFDPQGTGVRRGAVVINDSDPSTPQLVGLSGTGASNVGLNPTSITFPATAVGTSSGAVKINLTNSTGGNITLGNPAVTVTGPFINAATTTCTPNLIIAASGTCVINVQFHPTAVGFASGSISVADSDPTTPQSVSLQGNGTGVKFTPNAINFGTVTDGTKVSSTATITNVGTTPVYFTGAELSGANSADFSVNFGDGAPCGNTASNPLQPGKTCQITISFDPTTKHVESATYKLFDNSVGSPQTLPLSGTGQ